MSVFGVDSAVFAMSGVGVGLKAAVIFVLAWSVARWPGLAAAHRHLVWTVAVLAVLAIPALGVLMPSVPVSAPSVASPSPLRVASPVAPRGTPIPPPPEAEPVPLPSVPVSAPEPEASTLSAPVPETRPAEQAGSERSTDSGGFTWTVDGLVGLLLAGWAAGVLLLLAQVMAGALALRRWERRARPLDAGPVHEAARAAAAHLGLRRLPRVLEGPAGCLPMVWGVWRVCVLLPPAAEDWPAERLRSVLLHELGHVRRRDYGIQLLAEVTRALHWVNPLAWLAVARLRQEREHACDDLVVASGRAVGDYADDLLQIARAQREAGVLPAVALSRPRHLHTRLLALLDPARSHRPVRVGQAVAAGMVAAPLTALVAALTLSAAPLEADPAGSVPAVEVQPAAVEPERDALLVPGTDPVPMSRLQDGPDDRAPSAEEPPVRAAARQEAHVLCGPADGEAHRSMHHTDDDRVTLRREFGRCTSEVRIIGDLEFSPDFRRITGVGTRSSLRIEVDRPGVRERMDVTRGPDGGPRYAWEVDGQDRPMDADGEEWLAAALLDVFRTSTYRAEERAAWILEEQGVEGLLAESERMWSDHVRARYLASAVESDQITSAQLASVLRTAGRDVGSDHALAGILLAAADRHRLDGDLRMVFLEAARSLESDHQQGRVFSRALAWDTLTEPELSVLLEAAADGIESDHTLAEILVELAVRYPLEPELRRPYLRAAGSLESDHQRARVYGELLRSELTGEEIADVLAAASDISSDHQLATLLRDVANQDLSDRVLRDAFLEAARSIQSDHQAADVYGTVLRLEGLTEAEVIDVLRATGSIASDHQLASVLSEAVSRDVVRTTASQRALLDAAAAIGSDHQLESLLDQFLRAGTLDEDAQIAFLGTARGLGSDRALASVLVEFADRYPLDGRVADAFRAAENDIGSERHRRRVSEAVARMQ